MPDRPVSQTVLHVVVDAERLPPSAVRRAKSGVAPAIMAPPDGAAAEGAGSLHPPSRWWIPNGPGH